MSKKNKKGKKNGKRGENTASNKDGKGITATDVTNPYLREVKKLKKTIPNWDNLYSKVAKESFREQAIRLRVLGGPLAEKYSWAIPDARSLRVLQHFSPLVEMGAGKGYWTKLLRDMGVDVLAYDKYLPEDKDELWTEVLEGAPDVLTVQKELFHGRNLFLCYPDQAEAMAIEALLHFTGEYIIHIGELIHFGTLAGEPQSAWGRTSGSDFQVELAEQFHCLMKINLPRFPFSNDCLTVWKRTRFVEGLSDSSDEEEEEEQSSDDEGSDGDEAPMLIEINSKSKSNNEVHLKPWEVVNEESEKSNEWGDASEWNEQVDEEVESHHEEDDDRNEDYDDQFGDDEDFCSNQWGDIPENERLGDAVAPCLAFLLSSNYKAPSYDARRDTKHSSSKTHETTEGTKSSNYDNSSDNADSIDEGVEDDEDGYYNNDHTPDRKELSRVDGKRKLSAFLDTLDGGGRREGNKTNDALKTQERKISGVTIESETIGNSDKAAMKGHRVKVKYVGKLQNGKIFDQTKKNKTFQFRIGAGEVIEGWEIGVEGMREGGSRRLRIPPSLAYGEQGAGKTIPKNATLWFDITLVSII